jgi:hypothetical protein
MQFELQTRAAPAGLAILGGLVELREVPYGTVREAMAAGGKVGKSAEGLLAASLHVDGQPIGLAALLGLPGRFAGPIAKALAIVIELHGLQSDEPDEPENPAPADPPPGGAEGNA